MLDASKLIFDGHNLNVLGLLNFEFVSLREEMIRIWNIRHEAQRHSGTARWWETFHNGKLVRATGTKDS